MLAAEAADVIAAEAPPDDLARVIERHVAAPDTEPDADEREKHAVSLEDRLSGCTRIMRRFIEHSEAVDRPFVRVIGRIIYILTIDGGRDACTSTPIAVALLLFLKKHLDPVHRQAKTTRDEINATEQTLTALLYDRLGKLTSTQWRMAEKHPSERGYRLTEDGRFTFDGWPADIDFDPRNPDLWRRKKGIIRVVRGGGKLPAPGKPR